MRGCRVLSGVQFFLRGRLYSRFLFVSGTMCGTTNKYAMDHEGVLCGVDDLLRGRLYSLLRQVIFCQVILPMSCTSSTPCVSVTFAQYTQQCEVGREGAPGSVDDFYNDVADLINFFFPFFSPQSIHSTIWGGP